MSHYLPRHGVFLAPAPILFGHGAPIRGARLSAALRALADARLLSHGLSIGPTPLNVCARARINALMEAAALDVIDRERPRYGRACLP